jgi:hypothetical protein
MELVGHDDLQGRSAYQPTIHKQGNRVIAYVGHHGGKARNPLTGVDEDNGTSIVDVSDPARPRYLVHIPGAPGGSEQGGAQMARVCDRGGKTYLLRTFGNAVPNSGDEVWEVTDPAKPKKVEHGRDGAHLDAQELVGMRHGHRLSDRRRPRQGRSAPGRSLRVAHRAHDEDLRSQ